MKRIHITPDLPLMPRLRLLIVWNANMSVCVEVWMSLLHCRSQSCMSRHVNILALVEFQWNTPYLSHTHMHAYMHVKKKRRHPLHSRTQALSITLHTLSHKLHTVSSRSGWLPERLIYQSFWYSHLRKNIEVIFIIWTKSRCCDLITEEAMKY